MRIHVQLVVLVILPAVLFVAIAVAIFIRWKMGIL